LYSNWSITIILYPLKAAIIITEIPTCKYHKMPS
jgi:hypothetical protein